MSGQEFKVGDRVRVTERNGSRTLLPGDTGVVVGHGLIDRSVLDVRKDGSTVSHMIVPDRVEPVERKPEWFRVTIEGPRPFDAPEPGVYDESRTFEVCSKPGDTITVESIPAPVEPFKPGDRVRSVYAPDHEYTIGVDGYFSHRTNTYTLAEFEFSTDSYEKVDSAEVPF